MESGIVEAREVAIARAEACEVCFLDLAHYDIDYSNAMRLSRSLAEGLSAFPLFILGDIATVGMANPIDLRAVDQIRSRLRCEVDPVLCEPAALRRLIERAYAMAADVQGQASDPGGPGEAGWAEASLTTGKEPVVAAVNQILAQAVERGASDIHIGADEHQLHLRYRIDGALQHQQGPGIAAHDALIRRLKVIANLDLTQSRRPQDGKFRFVHGDTAIDVRLSIVPTVCGENAVLRLLTSSAALRGFGDLGMSADHVEGLESALAHPHGMLLVTGPTGSGKTTTVYTALKHLNTPERNIITIEDPVEVRMPVIRQVQVNAEIGLTFAGALRSILRQDPDVVFVGEIRDEETARIAIQAALTGHMVLTTLHTNDAAGAIPRLRDLGCPAFALNAALIGAVAQRLVRQVCRDCIVKATAEPGLARLFGIESDEGLVRGAGCGRCSSTGYRGRLGIYELLTLTDQVRAAIEAGASDSGIRSAACESGMRPMWKDGLAKARVGMTTLSEVARVSAVHGLDRAAMSPPQPSPEMRLSA